MHISLQIYTLLSKASHKKQHDPPPELSHGGFQNVSKLTFKTFSLNFSFEKLLKCHTTIAN